MVALALVFAWLVAPTSASGPDGEPNGFVSGLRYLAPALALGLALLPLGRAAIARGAPGVRWLVIGSSPAAPFTIAISDAAGVRQVLGGHGRRRLRGLLRP